MTVNPFHYVTAACAATATGLVAFFVVLGMAEERAQRRQR